MSENIYYGRGNSAMFDEYMDFINYVFGFNGNTNDFKKLLPKLYKPEYDPCGNSYVAVEDGKIKAAIGAFDHDISVCGQILKTRGIGNVAVHPYSRSRGFMKKLMNMALDDMINDGVVLSVLGGRRQRYNYFSYDKTGYVISMSVNPDNMRHVFGTERNHVVKFVSVGPNDIEILNKIRELSERRAYHPLRDKERYFEILSSWKQKTWAAFRNGSFCGYCISSEETVVEINLEDQESIREFVAAFYDFLGRGKLLLKIPPFERVFIEKLVSFCEFYDIEPSKSFSVLNYKAVISAFMSLKTKYVTLPDGELILRIHGRGGLENIEISVHNGKITVIDTDKEPFYDLEHLDTMNLIFAPISIKRDGLPDFAKIWFPLPIFLYSTDAV